MENTSTQTFEELVAEQKKKRNRVLRIIITLFTTIIVFLPVLHYSNTTVATLAVRGVIPKLNKILSKPVSRNCKINFQVLIKRGLTQLIR